MFLHVIADSSFAGNVYRVFEDAAPGANRYVVLSRTAAPCSAVPGATTVSSVDGALEHVACTSWDGLTVNGLAADELVTLAAGVPEDLACAWYAWGFEAYGRAPILRRRLLQPRTRRATREPVYSRRVELERRLALCQREIRDLVSPPLERFDFCVTQLPEEYELFRRHRLFVSTRYHWGAVGAIDDYVDLCEPIERVGPDIQVGNCAASSMNHLESFDLIARGGTGDRSVVVPLGYGDSAYRDLVIQAGRRAFGDGFVPLVDYLPLAEYSTLMQRCGIVVMNQMRQQALGTIVGALWRGATVYMNNTTVYRAYRRMGIDVRRLGAEYLQDARRGFAPLPVAAVARHREVLAEHQNRGRVIEETRHLLEELSVGRRPRGR